MPSVQASLYFLKKDPLHLTEKPYAFRYQIEDDSIRQSNMEMERKDSIAISDIRRREKPFSIESNGIAVFQLKSQMSYEDFYNPDKVSIYLRELELLLKAQLKATHVEVFRYGLRKRHPSFPISIGEEYAYDQPTSVAHIDTTPQEALEEVHRQHKEGAERLTTKRFQWINIWKPLRGPLNDWPLAVCDASTVNSAGDLEAADILYPDFVTENYQVYYKPGYKWYYLSNHDISEVIVFKQSDSDASACPGVPHSSFFNPSTPEGEGPRESIEARALVYYDET